MVGNRKSAGEVQAFEAAGRLHSAAVHLLRHAAQQDAHSGQGPARLSALSVLVFVGPKTLGELASVERVKPPTMTRVVAGLKRSGLVRMDPDPQDGRRKRISVTAKGERLLQAARKRRIQALTDVFSEVTAAEMSILRQATGIMEQSLQRIRR